MKNKMNYTEDSIQIGISGSSGITSYSGIVSGFTGTSGGYGIVSGFTGK